MFGRLLPNKNNKLRANTKAKRTYLSVEALEDRMVPADIATVTLAGSVLTIQETGSTGLTWTLAESATVDKTVSVSLGTGTFTYINNGTTSTGETSITATQVTTANVDLADTAKDHVVLAGNNTPTTQLTGGLTFTATDDLSITDAGAGFSVGGAFTINHNVAQNLTVTLGASNEVFGSLSVTQGAAQALVQLSGSDGQINGGASVSFGGGSTYSYFDLYNYTVTGDVNYQGSVTSDEMFLENDTVGGGVNATGGASASATTYIYLDNTTVNGGKGNVTFTGTGSVQVELEVGSKANNITVNGADTTNAFVDIHVYTGSTVEGNVVENGELGTLFMRVDGSTVDGNVSDSLGGLGNAILTLSSANIKGSVTHNAPGNETSAISAYITNTTIGGGLSLNALGATLNSTVSIEGTTIGSASAFAANPFGSFLSVTEGTGTLTLSIGDDTTSAIYGNVGIGTNGTGAVSITNGGTGAGEGSTIAGSLFFNAGTSSPQASAYTATFNNATVGGFVLLNGENATGASSVQVDGSVIGSAAGFAANPHGTGYLSITEGTGALTVAIGETTAASIFGDVGIGTFGTGLLTLNVGATTAPGSIIKGDLYNNFTPANSTTSPINASIVNASIGGFVSLNAENANGASTVTASGDLIGGFFSIATGTGADSINLTNVTVQAELGIATGGGNDSVSLTNDNVTGATSVGGSSPAIVAADGTILVPAGAPAAGTLAFNTSGGVYQGEFSYLGKTGDDTVILGTAGNSTLFKAGLPVGGSAPNLFFGNGGTDTLDHTNAVFTNGFQTDGTFTVTP